MLIIFCSRCPFDAVLFTLVRLMFLIILIIFINCTCICELCIHTVPFCCSQLGAASAAKSNHPTDPPSLPPSHPPQANLRLVSEGRRAAPVRHAEAAPRPAPCTRPAAGTASPHN